MSPRQGTRRVAAPPARAWAVLLLPHQRGCDRKLQVSAALSLTAGVSRIPFRPSPSCRRYVSQSLSGFITTYVHACSACAAACK